MVHVPKELEDLVLESLALHFNKKEKTYFKTSASVHSYIPSFHKDLLSTYNWPRAMLNKEDTRKKIF